MKNFNVHFTWKKMNEASPECFQHINTLLKIVGYNFFARSSGSLKSIWRHIMIWQVKTCNFKDKMPSCAIKFSIPLALFVYLIQVFNLYYDLYSTDIHSVSYAKHNSTALPGNSSGPYLCLLFHIYTNLLTS